MNNVFTAIQNRDGEALSRMSGYEHQYTNNDNVVNMSAERLVDALFKQLKQLFPAAVVTNLKTPEQEVAAKQQWIAAFAEGGIRTREQVSAGMRHARASESPFWPSPGQFIKWCKDSKMVLGVTIDDVMAEFHRYSKEKSLYPGGPERFPWRHPVMYWVVCDTRTLTAIHRSWIARTSHSNRFITRLVAITTSCCVSPDSMSFQLWLRAGKLTAKMFMDHHARVPALIYLQVTRWIYLATLPSLALLIR